MTMIIIRRVDVSKSLDEVGAMSAELCQRLRRGLQSHRALVAVAVKGSARPPLCGEHGELWTLMAAATDATWVRPKFRFPQSLQRVGKRKRKAHHKA
jgi:nicotinamide mononucleotide (NMN) deamidase PncC